MTQPELAERIKKLPRKVFSVALADLGIVTFTTSNESIGIRMLSSYEHEQVAIDAAEYLKGRFAKTKDRESDLEIKAIGSNIYAAFALARAITDSAGRFPLFGDGASLMKEITIYELRTLFNFYESCKAKVYPGSFPSLEEQNVKDISFALSALSTTDAPNALLAQMPKESLEELVIRMSMLLTPPSAKLQELTSDALVKEANAPTQD